MNIEASVLGYSEDAGWEEKPEGDCDDQVERIRRVPVFEGVDLMNGESERLSGTLDRHYYEKVSTYTYISSRIAR